MVLVVDEHRSVFLVLLYVVLFHPTSDLDLLDRLGVLLPAELVAHEREEGSPAFVNLRPDLGGGWIPMFSVRGGGVDGDLEVVHQSTPEPSLRLWEFNREKVLLQPVELPMQELDEGQVEVGEEERSVRRGRWEVLTA